jgi:hypothetical protein
VDGVGAAYVVGMPQVSTGWIDPSCRRLMRFDRKKIASQPALFGR